MAGATALPPVCYGHDIRKRWTTKLKTEPFIIPDVTRGADFGCNRSSIEAFIRKEGSYAKVMPVKLYQYGKQDETVVDEYYSNLIEEFL